MTSRLLFLHILSFRPPTRQDLEFGILVFSVGRFRRMALLEPNACVGKRRAESMIVRAKHLGFVQRQIRLLPFDPPIALKFEAVCFERVGFAEQMRIAGLIEDALLELNTPRIPSRPLSRFVN